MRNAVIVFAAGLSLLLGGCATQVNPGLQPVKVTETTGCSLCTAAYQGNLTQVTYLLQHGANPNAVSNGKTPIGWAVFSKNGIRWDIVLMLLQFHADPNIPIDKYDFTALMGAGQTSTRALEALIKAGADVNAQRTFGDTPLIETIVDAKKDKASRVADLLKAKANPNIRNKKGVSALDLAVDNLWRAQGSQENLPIIRMLLAAGAEPDSALKQLALLMRHGLAANGSVPHGTKETLRLLLAYGAKPQDVRDPFLLSVIGNRPDLAKILINAGDPVDLDNKSGESAVDIAIRNNNIKQAELLLGFGAGLPEVYANEDPLVDAYADGNIPMVRLIIRHGPFQFFGSPYDWPPKEQLIKDKMVKNKATEAVYLQAAKPFVVLARIETSKINRNLPARTFNRVLENYEEEPLISPIFRVNTFSILALRPDLMPLIPEQAIGDATLGNALWKKAKSRTDMIQAADEYEKAAELAPWVAAYQRNLCILEYDANEFRRAEIDCGSYSHAFPLDGPMHSLWVKTQNVLNGL